MWWHIDWRMRQEEMIRTENEQEEVRGEIRRTECDATKTEQDDTRLNETRRNEDGTGRHEIERDETNK